MVILNQSGLMIYDRDQILGMSLPEINEIFLNKKILVNDETVVRLVERIGMSYSPPGTNNSLPCTFETNNGSVMFEQIRQITIIEED